MSTTIRPHKIGLAFIALALAMLLAAINYGNNLIFFISFLFISLLLNSGWQTWRSLSAARIELDGVAPHFADEPGRSTLHVQARLPNPSVSVWLDDLLVADLGWAAGSSHYALLLPLFARGVYAAPRWAVSSRYPLGLWEARRVLPKAAETRWVYPARVGSLPFARAPVLNPRDAGDARAMTDEEFDHLRPYVPGDAQSRIAFKHYARTGQLVSQQWAGQVAAQSGEVLLDFSEVPGTTEQRLCQLSAWIDALAVGDQRFTLRLPGLADRSGQDAAHRRACWQLLAGFGQSQASN